MRRSLFALQEFGNIYTRIMNPTTDVFEQRIAALEGGVGALAFASGQAAETLAILNIASAGDEIVSTTSLYGGTYNLFAYTLPKLGITVRFVEPNADAVKAAITDKTKAVYSETVGNPDLLDPRHRGRRRGRARRGRAADPRQHDADAVPGPPDRARRRHRRPLGDEVHRRARHRIGGIVVDGGTFDWKASGRFPDFTEPDPSYHGLVYTDVFTANFGANIAFIIKVRVQVLRDIGAAISPVQRLPLPAGHRDAAAADGAAQPERAGGGEVPERAPEGGLGQLPRPARAPGLRDARASTTATASTARSSASASRAG